MAQFVEREFCSFSGGKKVHQAQNRFSWKLCCCLFYLATHAPLPLLSQCYEALFLLDAVGAVDVRLCEFPAALLLRPALLLDRHRRGVSHLLDRHRLPRKWPGLGAQHFGADPSVRRGRPDIHALLRGARDYLRHGPRPRLGGRDPLPLPRRARPSPGPRERFSGSLLHRLQ